MKDKIEFVVVTICNDTKIFKITHSEQIRMLNALSEQLPICVETLEEVCIDVNDYTNNFECIGKDI